ncbi:hypothetical protein PHLCEN_2v12712 [Hermanssonia centrifuga]|uniref:Uncharacterized protein n=1 Tax=Hermanssonia centrifuga TaxID=98765 RepID=A0A2R6NGD5_9APHY|nr:hypothetical protein PHLCEN_2v12712 [Hermanssonia centrifuga]
MRLFRPQARQELHQSRPPSHAVFQQDSLTALPPRRMRTRESKLSTRFESSQLTVQDGSAPAYITSSPKELQKTLVPDSPGRSPSMAKHSRYHLPFHTTPPPSAPHSRKPSIHSQNTDTARDSPLLDAIRGSHPHPPSPIIFASPSRAESQNHTVVVTISPSPLPDNGFDDVKDDESIQVRPIELDMNADDGVSGSLRWARDSDRGSIGKNEFVYITRPEDEEDSSTYAFPPYPRIRRVASGRKYF